MRQVQNFRKRFFFVGSLFFATAVASSASATCFVNASATGANDGSSWTNAYTNPQSALADKACKEVWVAKGIYKPTSGTDPKVTFLVPSYVQMYGGFSGVETNRDERAPATNLTVLSGDIDGNDANATTTGVDTSPSDIRGTNSYHVVFLNGGFGSVPIMAKTVIDGFTITGGNANFAGGTQNGGGLYCYGKGNDRDDSLANCSPVLQNLVFSGNIAAQDGGAIYFDATDRGMANATIANSRFQGNSAGNAGGAIGIRADQGGIGNPSIDRVAFKANAAKLGGAIFNEATGTGDTDPSDSSPMLSNVVFTTNVADTGGAMYIHAVNGGRTRPDIAAVTFSENGTNPKETDASPYGGAVFILADGIRTISSPSFVNTTFNQNHATLGGAIFDGILHGGDVNLTLTNVTIDRNSADIGGALYNIGDDAHDSVTLRNVILWDDDASLDATTSEIKNSRVELTISHSALEKGCPFSMGFICDNIVGTSPLLRPLGDNGGFTPTMLPAATGSAIDAANDGFCPPIDQRGQVRPQGAHCDIGAVEISSNPQPIADPQSVIVPHNTDRLIALTGSDPNPGVHSLTFTLVGSPRHGSLVQSGNEVTYTPTTDYTGPDAFTFSASDENGTSDVATVSIVVQPTLPVAAPLSDIVQRNVSKQLTLSATDSNAGSSNFFAFNLYSSPTSGTVTISGNIATYTPDANYTGPDAFTYTATDEFGISLPAVVSLEVVGPLPVADPKTVVVPHNTSKAITLSASDANAGGPFHFTYSVSTPPLRGTLGVVAGNQVIYTPNHDYAGPDAFTYIVTDENGISKPAPVSITVQPVGGSDAPPVSSVPSLNFWGMVVLGCLMAVTYKRT
ncbi:MAG: tandem-95 repeat protein [Rudaea sp.]